MKNKILAIAIVTLFIFSSGLLAVNAERGGNGANEIDLNGFHYTLNIIGKKSDWKGGGGYDNPDRSTIFVPQDTSTFSYTLPDGTICDNIAIYFTKGTEFAVLDGNAFDEDGSCAIQLDERKYSVWICSRAKPHFSTQINGTVFINDTAGGSYLYCIGELTVTRKWKDAEDLFWVDSGEDPWGMVGSTPQWIFDYLENLEGYQIGEDLYLEDGIYFWDFDNNGNKLVKVRFYPIS